MNTNDLLKNEKAKGIFPRVLKDINIGDLVELHVPQPNNLQNRDKYTGYVSSISPTGITLSLGHPSNTRSEYDFDRQQVKKEIIPEKIGWYRVLRKDNNNLDDVEET